MIVEIPLITTLIAIVACFYASYSDLKWGIIPNKLTFPLIAIGIILNSVYAFMIGEIWIIVMCLVMTGVIFALGYIFWKMGAWAGGDVKLFTALAALLPFSPVLVSYKILGVDFPVEGAYPFPLTLIINSILSVFPFILMYVVYVVVKTKRHLIDELLSPVKEYKEKFVLTLVITSSVTITMFITQELRLQIIIISLILIYLLTMVISKMPNRVKAVVVSLVVVASLFYNFNITIYSIILLYISITILGIIRKLLFSVNKEALQDEYPLEELKEGMIPAHNLYQRDDEVYVDKKTFVNKIVEAIQTKDMSLLTTPPGKNLIANLAAGLTPDDIELLKKLHKEGKISNKFKVKRGVPFAPSIFIGLLISLFIGDMIVILQKIISWII
ncbi:MAG TPA: A24 family peptidase C-terminal domain-containing protein [Methanobacterium sp.]|jgi:preflagellin peptidase FlaK|nr:prepilin peptidase [Methanobacterium sp.]HOI40625.1 A24 family peptidase C-terminal domain-containing protein [Methanobacterium sp.]